MNNNNRNLKTSITVLAALGIMCSSQEGHSVNAIEQKSSSIEFEQNATALDELLQGQAESFVTSEAEANMEKQSMKHHHSHHRHHSDAPQDDLISRQLIKSPTQAFGVIGLRDAEVQAAAQQSLAEQQTMDLVKEELADVINKSGDRAEQAYLGEHPVEPDQEDSDKAQSMATMAPRDEKEDPADDRKDPTPQPIGQLIEKVKQKQMSADDYDDREREQQELRNPGEKAAANIMAMQKQARANEEQEEREAARAQEELREAVAQKAEDERKATGSNSQPISFASSKVSKSASSLANELQDSMYKPRTQSFQTLAEQSDVPKSMGNPSETANLIAQAIIHQKEKQNGIEVEPEVQPHSFAEQRHIESEEPHVFKPIVSKDELLESQQMKPLSLQENSAKNAAVQRTLAMLKGGQGSSAAPQPFAAPHSFAASTGPFQSTHSPVSEMHSPLSDLAAPQSVPQQSTDSQVQQAKDKAVKHMMELMKHKSSHASPAQEVSAASDTVLPIPLPVLSGPSPNAAPVSQEPVHKAQVTIIEPPKKELTPKEKEEAARADEKKSQQEAEAEMEAMNSVEDLQHKAQAKQEAAATGQSLPDTKGKQDNKKTDAILDLQSSTSKISPGSPAEATLQKSLESMSVPQQLPTFTPPPITAPLVQKDSTSQKSLIDKILHANKAFNVMGPSVNAPTSLAPIATPPPAPLAQAQPSAQENAVQKTLQAMGFGAESKSAPVTIPDAAPTPVSVAAPAPAPAPTPVPSPINPMIMQSPQAPAASSAPITIETSSLAPPPSYASTEPPKEIVAEKPKVVEKPKEKTKPKEEKKKEDSSTFSIVTSGLDVDEKEMGIKAAVIPEKASTEEKKPAPAKDVKEQKLTSKQREDKNGPSFTIETTSVDAEVETPTKALPQQTSVSQKAPEKKVEKKVEKKLVAKPAPDAADFKIETTTATPQMMKALMGDTSPDEPEIVEAPVAPKVIEAPKQAKDIKPEAPKVQANVTQQASSLSHKDEKKQSGLQGTSSIELTKAAPKEQPTEAVKETAAPEVIGEAISGAFGDLPGFEQSKTAETAKRLSEGLSSVQIEDVRKSIEGKDSNLKAKIQDIMKTIQPALSAIGTENHASVEIVIKDTDEPKAISTSINDAARSLIKTNDDPPKMQHPSTNSPPIHMIHSELPAPPSIVPMPTVSPSLAPIAPMPSLASATEVPSPLELLKRQNGIAAPASAPLAAVTSEQKVSDILSAVTKASSQTPAASVSQPSYNVPVVMPVSQPANLAMTPSSTAISPLLAPPAPIAQPAPVMNMEYMNAVANSIQKSKQEDEEKHQTAVQKTLALALQKQDLDNKKNQEEQAIKSAELIKEIAEQKKKSEDEQKKHDDVIQKSIELAKKQHVFVAPEQQTSVASVSSSLKDQIIANAIANGKKAESGNDKKVQDMKSLILAKSSHSTPKSVLSVPKAEPEKTNEQKALDLASKMVEENPQNALKMLAKEENEQKPAVEATTSLAKAQAAPQEAPKDDIISRTIALAKAAKDKEEHPLGGALFGGLNVQTSLENTQLPDEKTLAKLDSNSTKSTNITKNATKQLIAEKSSNITEAKTAVKNETKLANKNETTKANATSMNKQNTSANASTNANKTAQANVTANVTAVKVVQNNATKATASNKTSTDKSNSTSKANASVKANVTKPAAKSLIAISEQFDFEVQEPEDVDALVIATKDPSKKNLDKMKQKSVAAGLSTIIDKFENKIETALHKMF